MRLWFIMMAIWCTEVSSRNPIFDRFIQDNDGSSDDDDDYYSDSTEEDTDEEEEDLPMYEYYEDVMQSAFEFFGENREIISMVKQQLDQASGEDNGLSRQLHKLLQNTNDLINQKTEILREKFRSELTYDDMTDPIEESMVNTLLTLWKEVKLGLEQMKVNKKMDGVEELQKVLDNMDRKTRTRYGEVQGLMAKIVSLHHNSANQTDVHNKNKAVEKVNSTRAKVESLRGRTSL